MIKIKQKHNIAVFQAILAAALYAISSPLSKLLLLNISPIMMAAFLYLGAGIGMSVLGLIRNKTQKEIKEARLTKRELPFIIAMVVLDIAAPIFLMFGLTMTNAANVSLLNNFEIVATAIIALFLFKEIISKRLWVAIILITLSSILITVEDTSSFSFSIGSVFVILACICWGFENNCTRKLSVKDPLQIVVIKGFGSGLGSFIIALAVGEHITNYMYIPAILLLGFFAYGLSIFFYVYAQREIGAAKTSAYYAVSPFIGVILSFIMLGERPNLMFGIALTVMIIGAYLASIDMKK